MKALDAHRNAFVDRPAMTTLPKGCSLGLWRAAAVLVAFWLSGLPLAAETLTVPEIVRHAKPAVAQIAVFEEEGVKIATGFFIDKEGDLVTNFHVIAGADLTQVFARVPSGEMLTLRRLVCWSYDPDIAVMQFAVKESVPYLALGNPANAQEGQHIVTIGNPEGLEGTVSEGIISAKRGPIIQISAPISHGSSGSPVLDESGQVIGVATWLNLEGQNLNFAISVNAIRLLEKNYQEDIVAGADVSPVTPAQIRDAETMLEGAYETLLTVVEPEEQELLERDQDLWLRRRALINSGSKGRYNFTLKRCAEFQYRASRLTGN
jgi:S1-C subfamily serine protease